MHQGKGENRRGAVAAQRRTKETISAGNFGLGGRCRKCEKTRSRSLAYSSPNCGRQRGKLHQRKNSEAKTLLYSLEPRQRLTKMKPQNTRNRQDVESGGGLFRRPDSHRRLGTSDAFRTLASFIINFLRFATHFSCSLRVLRGD